MFQQRQGNSPLSVDSKILNNNNNNDTETSLEQDKVKDEFASTNTKGLDLIEINNNKPQTLNNNLCENYKGRGDDASDDQRGTIVAAVTDNTNAYNNSMGSNVSRYSEKGLSGRRAHSSGNLFTSSNTTSNGNATNTPSKKTHHNKKYNKKKSNQTTFIPDDLSDVASISTTIGVTSGSGCYDNASFTDPCIVNDISLQQLYSPYNSNRTKSSNVSKQQKQAYHGSLPNNLDDTDDDVVDGVLNQQRGKRNI